MSDTATRNPRLAALMAVTGPNPLRDAFSSVARCSFEFLYGPRPIERVKETLEDLLAKAPHQADKPVYVNQGSDELKMLAELLLLNRSTARQLAVAMAQKPVLEVDTDNMRHVITFRPLDA